MRNIYTTGKWFLCVFICCLPGLSLAEPLQDISLSGRYAISGALGRDQQQYHIRPGQNSGFLENSTQAFTALLSGSGVLEIKPMKHRIRMRLAGVGTENNTGNVTPVDVSTSVNRITYDYGMLKQWFVNGPMGLQQGFTLSRRPDQQPAGRFVLSLEVGGDLRPTLAANGTGVAFLGQDGSKILTYSGLLVVDADGKQLPARFETGPAEIRIIVEDGNARYPVVVDPVFQSARLTADDGAAGDSFGRSVAIDGDIVVVGAPSNDIGGNRQGSAYVFRKTGSGWTDMAQTAKLIAGDGTTGDWFGSSVAISGDTIVVGADSAHAGGSSRPGAVYIFLMPSSGWTNMIQTAKLTASDGADQDRFGGSIAIDNDTVVVGADGTNTNGHVNQGKAYVFVKPSSGWSNMTESAMLIASDGAANDYLGQSVAIDGNTVVVGAPGTQTNRGSIYVFERPESGWANMNHTAKLMASDGADNDLLGSSVAISDTIITAGAPGFSTGGSGSQGAAYVFVRSGPHWIDMEETSELRAKDVITGDHFGQAVAIENNTIVVGSPYHNYSGTSANMGAVYTFQKPAGGWPSNMRAKAKFLSNDGRADDHLGWSVALSGATIVAGAPEHTVNNNQGQGAAYVFRYNKKSSWPMFISAVTSHVGRIVAGNAAAGHPTSGDTSTHRLFIGSLELRYTTSVIPHIDADMISFCYVRMPVVSDTGTLYCETGNLHWDKTEIEGDNKIRRAASIVFSPIGSCSRSRHSCTVEPTGNGSETIWQWYLAGSSWHLVPGMPITIPITWFDNPVYFGNMNLIDGGCEYVDVTSNGGKVEFGLCLVHRP